MVARLPLEKSILWPGSRCGSCFQAIPASANIPVLSYLLLRGHCRICKAKFSSRYMWVELGSGLAFAGLFYFDIYLNGHNVEFVRDAQWQINQGWVPWQLWVFFLHHATLLAFLIAASLCDLDGKVIPLPLTVTGTLIGLVFATFAGWPWPNIVEPAIPQGQWGLMQFAGKIPRGVYNWPFWEPSRWFPPGSLQLGLLTGLIGAAVGNLMMRGVKFLFEQGMGVEAMGLGDADLMMMVGAFVGWQVVVLGFFLGTFAALFLAIPMLLWKRDRYLPFGPGLAIGSFVALLGWQSLGRTVQPFFFEWVVLSIGIGMLGGGMFIASTLLGWRRK